MRVILSLSVIATIAASIKSDSKKYCAKLLYWKKNSIFVMFIFKSRILISMKSMLDLGEFLNFFINQNSILIGGSLIMGILYISKSYNALYKSWKNIKQFFEAKRSKLKINIEYNCLRLIKKRCFDISDKLKYSCFQTNISQ